MAVRIPLVLRCECGQTGFNHREKAAGYTDDLRLYNQLRNSDMRMLSNSLSFYSTQNRFIPRKSH